MNKIKREYYCETCGESIAAVTNDKEVRSELAERFERRHQHPERSRN